MKKIALLIRKPNEWALWGRFDDDAAAERSYNTKIKGRGITAWAWWGPATTAKKMLKDPSYDPDTDIDVLFKRVDDLLSSGNFAACDKFLDAFDVNAHDTNLLVGVLSITVNAKDGLEARPRLVERVEARLMQLAPDRIDGLMSGLR